jgi:hypothetical protein
VTLLVGGPFVELRGAERVGEMRTSGLIPMDVEVNSCLFAAVPGAGQPLVEFNGIDATETESLLPWRVQTGNQYANFDPSAAAMVVRSGIEGSTPKESNWNQWLTFAREPAGNRVGTARFERAPMGLRDLAQIKPADAVVTEVGFLDLPESKPGEAGADPKLLPEPWSIE